MASPMHSLRHAAHPVVPSDEVPCLDKNTATGRLKLPGHPLGPFAVSRRIGNEVVVGRGLGRRGVAGHRGTCSRTLDRPATWTGYAVAPSASLAAMECAVPRARGKARYGELVSEPVPRIWPSVRLVSSVARRATAQYRAPMNESSGKSKRQLGRERTNVTATGLYRSTGDPFGLERERLIIESGVRQIFTPHRPILDSDLLYGRKAEVRKIVETLNTPGQHALLYGERGVGKSSLANISAEALHVGVSRRIYVKRCDSSDSFESILRDPLKDVGIDLDLREMTRSNHQGRQFGLVGRVNISADRAQEIVAVYQRSGSLSPSIVVYSGGSRGRA